MLRAVVAIPALVLAAAAVAAQLAPTAAPAADAEPPPTIIFRTIPSPPPAAATPVPAAASQPVAAPEPLICRSSLATGSLIVRHRQCLTKAQWRYVDDAHETEARRLMINGMTKPFCDAHC